MRLGPMRHKLVFQALVDNSPSQDAGGVPDQQWTDSFTTFGEIKVLKGRELIAAQAVNAEVTSSIRIRYRAGVVPKMRAVFLSTRYYDILAAMNEGERNRELTLLVREGLNDG